jgi:hypothetical protein
MYELLGDKPSALAVAHGYWGHSRIARLSPGQHNLRLCYLQASGEKHWDRVDDRDVEVVDLSCLEGDHARVRDVEVKIREDIVTVVHLRDDAFLDCPGWAPLLDTSVRADLAVEELLPIPWGGVASDIPELVRLLKESEKTTAAQDMEARRRYRDDLLRVLAFDDFCRIGDLPTIEQFLPSEKLGYLARRARDLVQTKSPECLVRRLPTPEN